MRSVLNITSLLLVAAAVVITVVRREQLPRAWPWLVGLSLLVPYQSSPLVMEPAGSLIVLAVHALSTEGSQRGVRRVSGW